MTYCLVCGMVTSSFLGSGGGLSTLSYSSQVKLKCRVRDYWVEKDTRESSHEITTSSGEEGRLGISSYCDSGVSPDCRVF